MDLVFHCRTVTQGAQRGTRGSVPGVTPEPSGTRPETEEDGEEARRGGEEGVGLLAWPSERGADGGVVAEGRVPRGAAVKPNGVVVLLNGRDDGLRVDRKVKHLGKGEVPLECSPGESVTRGTPRNGGDGSRWAEPEVTHGLEESPGPAACALFPGGQEEVTSEGTTEDAISRGATRIRGKGAP